MLFSKIFDWLAELHPKRILDIGCGVGYLTSAVQERTGAQVIGIDFSQIAIEESRELYSPQIFLRADAVHIPFPPNSFDSILVINLIEHLCETDQRRLLAEVKRVLKEEGRLILSTPDSNSLYTQIAIHDPTHLAELSREDLFHLISDYLTIEEVSYTNSIGRFPRQINRVLSAILPADLLLRASNQILPSKDFLSQFLKIYPAAHALARACEAKALLGVLLEGPILDVGCGDGSFMEIFGNHHSIAVGVDIDANQLRCAKTCKSYKSILVCDGATLPFAEDSFASVISNSVFEHIGNPTEVLKEAARVTRTHGKVVFVVPNHRTREWWLGCELWRSFKDRVWEHRNLRDNAWWTCELHKVGFGEVKILEFANRDLIRSLDCLFLPAAVWFTLKRIRLPAPSLGRIRAFRNLMVRVLEGLYWRNDKGPGASYLVEATKL